MMILNWLLLSDRQQTELKTNHNTSHFKVFCEVTFGSSNSIIRHWTFLVLTWQVLHLDFWLLFRMWFLMLWSCEKITWIPSFCCISYKIYEVLTSDGVSIMENLLTSWKSSWWWQCHGTILNVLLRCYGKLDNGVHLMALNYLHHQQPSKMVQLSTSLQCILSYIQVPNLDHLQCKFKIIMGAI